LGTIELGGELDLSTVHDFHEVLDQVATPGRALVLDLSQVTFMDSIGVHGLLKAWHMTGEPVVLQNPPARVRRLLAICDPKSRPQAWMIQDHAVST